jgi:predicted phosphodiesterase
MNGHPGRTCPTHYSYGAQALAAAPALRAGCLYVAGGLYGNRFALHEILRMAAREPVTPCIAFNGDFHWFDTDPRTFEAVNRGVLEHLALRGNVETELAGEDTGNGCGCAYPEWVADAEVERSNQILARLRDTAHGLPRERARLGALPMFATFEVGDLRIGVVHGDLESLAGWGFSQERLAQKDGRAHLGKAFALAGVRVVASSHTCLPVAMEFALPTGRCALINNGAAGMPNFADTRFGLITRIGIGPSPLPATYGLCLEGIHIEALPVHYDHPVWVQRFLSDWPAGSDAHAAYFRRIESGPPYHMEQAARRGFRLSPRAEQAA